jgi:orotate phosphoribosyltransferase
MFREFFKDWDNDVILIGTGVSGTLALGIIAGIYPKIPIGIVRKKTENCHSTYSIECQYRNGQYRRWVFVDDLTATGETFRNVKAAVDVGDQFTEAPELVYCVFYNGRVGVEGVKNYSCFGICEKLVPADENGFIYETKNLL